MLLLSKSWRKNGIETYKTCCRPVSVSFGLEAKIQCKVFLKEYPRKIAELAIRSYRKIQIEIIELRVMPDHVLCFVQIQQQ